MAGRQQAAGQVQELAPVANLQTGWFVFLAEPACDASQAAAFVNEVENARLTTVPAQRRKPSDQKAWLPQVLALLQWLDPGIPSQVRSDTDVQGVPLTEVPARPGAPADPRLAVMLSGDGGWAKDTVPVIPEVERLTWAKRLCIYGTEETDSGCPALASAGVTAIAMPGDHHFGEDYPGIVTRLLGQAPP